MTLGTTTKLERDSPFRLGVLRGALLGLLIVPWLTFGSTAAATAGAMDAARERVIVRIQGMSCTSCAAGIRAMLNRSPGVIAAEVSYERAEATVDFKPAETSPAQIADVISRLGYTATVANPSSGVRSKSGNGNARPPT